MVWTFADAVELACQMYRDGEIRFDDLDKVATELWQEMQNDKFGALIGDLVMLQCYAVTRKNMVSYNVN